MARERYQGRSPLQWAEAWSEQLFRLVGFKNKIIFFLKPAVLRNSRLIGARGQRTPSPAVATWRLERRVRGYHGITSLSRTIILTDVFPSVQKCTKFHFFHWLHRLKTNLTVQLLRLICQNSCTPEPQSFDITISTKHRFTIFSFSPYQSHTDI